MGVGLKQEVHHHDQWRTNIIHRAYRGRDNSQYMERMVEHLEKCIDQAKEGSSEELDMCRWAKIW